jgi:hypothetical protein
LPSGLRPSASPVRPASCGRTWRRASRSE